MYFSQELLNYYNNKIITDGIDLKEPESTFNYNEKIIDVTYVKYIMFLHLKNVIDYIESKGIILGNVELNIKFILNEIINDEVNKSYYKNTMEIYTNIINNNMENLDVYNYLDQAIKRDNLRMIYYIIYDRQEDIVDWYHESILTDLLGFEGDIQNTSLSIW